MRPQTSRTSIYKTEQEKFKAVIEEIKELHAKGQPVLVGTISIEKSEVLSELLKKPRVPHYVLNAKQHEREAEIVAQAGRKGTVTIATNMAGRGTDIFSAATPRRMAETVAPKANPEAHRGANMPSRAGKIQGANGPPSTTRSSSRGGLHILGTERHESRRIDNQLRGRSGRQGDPGSHASTFRSRTT